MTGKPRWRPVHGVLLVDKPEGITSTAALARARRALSAEKGGHTGTLDPMASGLLPLCFGEATKFAADLLDADKAYVATARLGITTTTGDREGDVVETREVAVDRVAIDAAAAGLTGDVDQVPPMHSALKRDGKPLYEYARAGITLERAARRVRIHRLDILRVDGVDVTFAVECSKGTYVRSLAEDLGAALGCGAHLIALRRTMVGRLRLDESVPLAAFEAASDREASLRPVDTLIATLPRVDLDDERARRFTEGQRLAWPDGEPLGRVRVYRASGPMGGLLGTAMLGADARLAPLRLVAQAGN